MQTKMIKVESGKGQTPYTPWLYAHGEFEEELAYDILYAEDGMPPPGEHKVFCPETPFLNLTVFVWDVWESAIGRRRVGLVVSDNDTESVEYARNCMLTEEKEF